MFNTSIIKQNIINDMKPLLFTKYLLLNEVIMKDINFNIINVLLNISDEIITYKEDLIVIRYNEIITIKLISAILKEYVDLTKYGLSPLFDKQTSFHLLKIFENMGGPKFEHSLGDKECILLDEEYSDDLKNYISLKFKEYYMKYSYILNDSKKICIDELKTNKKYLIGI